MFARFLLAASVLSLSGCLVESHSPQSQVTLAWSFQGQDCTKAGVSSVNVQLFDIQGAPLTDDDFACSQGAASYQNLASGAYGYQISGLVSSGSVGFQAQGTLTVNPGANSFDLNLAPPS